MLPTFWKQVSQVFNYETSENTTETACVLELFPEKKRGLFDWGYNFGYLDYDSYYDDSGNDVPTSGINATIQKLILKEHNNHRGLERAQDMFKLVGTSSHNVLHPSQAVEDVMKYKYLLKTV